MAPAIALVVTGLKLPRENIAFGANVRERAERSWKIATVARRRRKKRINGRRGTNVFNPRGASLIAVAIASFGEEGER